MKRTYMSFINIRIMKAIKLIAIINDSIFILYIYSFITQWKLSRKLFRQFRKSMMLMAYDSISTQRYRWPNRSRTITQSHLNAVTFRQIFPETAERNYSIPLIIPATHHRTVDLRPTQTTFK